MIWPPTSIPGWPLAPPAPSSAVSWSIRADIGDYPAPDTLPCPPQRTAEPAAVPTRLKTMDDGLQERLINWGYAITDAALRAVADPGLPAPDGFPYGSGV